MSEEQILDSIVKNCDRVGGGGEAVREFEEAMGWKSEDLGRGQSQ